MLILSSVSFSFEGSCLTPVNQRFPLLSCMIWSTLVIGSASLSGNVTSSFPSYLQIPLLSSLILSRLIQRFSFASNCKSVMCAEPAFAISSKGTKSVPTAKWTEKGRFGIVVGNAGSTPEPKIACCILRNCSHLTPLIG